MHPLLDELRRVLDLEQRRHADNAAVIGGLDAYLANWRQRAVTAPFRRQLVHLPRLDAGGYAALGPQGRLGWLNRALAWTARQSPSSGRADRLPTPTPTPPRPARPAASKEQRATRITIDSPITVLSGVSAATAGRLARLGIATVGDLLYHLPHRYNDFAAITAVADLQPGLVQTAAVNLWEAHEIKVGRDMPSTEAIVGDATGNIAVVWFGNPYVARSLVSGARLVLSGRVGVYRGQKRLESPEWEPLDTDELTHAGRIVPVYPLTAGLNAKMLRRMMRRVVDAFAEAVPDLLPDAVRVRQQLPPLAAALRQVHFPDDFALAASARRRLAFDELFMWQLGLRERRRAWREREVGQPIVADRAVVDGFIASLPFALTAAQRRVLDEALADMARPQPMTRLLQGDVGSGKTVVAAAAMAAAAAAGFQSVLMAPTEILAEQHYRTLCQLFGALPGQEGRLALLTGATPRADREAAYASAADGSLDILVGTHAVIQEGLEFARLGLAIVDEQHRFGVMQRSALTVKGASPHLLVMSATPIPRSLALVLYGDLDLSVIDELPPGRLPVQTRYLRPRERAWAYSFIRDEVQAGRQAFVVCPLIEESDTLQTRAAVAEFENLSRTVFPDLRLGLLHGRLSGATKDEVMRRFQRGELDVLVSTPVIEVGIDVPNATVMLIEGAERFGLAQLHQFRGRVGRGAHQSYCLLLSDSASGEARQRLALVEANADGFALAEADLRLRGPGEFFGTRQSGPFSLLKAASLADVELLETARAEAIALLDADPDLKGYPELRAAAGRLWQRAAATG